jgi:predicted extracellular nuclease
MNKKHWLKNCVSSFGPALLLLWSSCGPLSAVTIMDIQGDGLVSPLDGDVVEVSGVVTFVRSRADGFFLQDPTGDGDCSTSDGIFVSTEKTTRLPAVGDAVRVTGRVEELQFGRAQPRTQLVDVASLDVVSTGNPPPRTTVLDRLPKESLREGVDFWESLEGMRVSISDGRVVAPTSGYGELVILTEADALPGSGYVEKAQQIFLRSLGESEVDYNPERVLVAGNPGEPLIVRPGDSVVELVGVVDYTYGNYKIRPTQVDLQTRSLPLTPVSRRSGASGDTVITTFNVENLFDLEDDPDKDEGNSTPTPEELEIKLHKLTEAIREELRLPEIIVVQEVENTSILSELADRINRTSHTGYVATSRGSSDGRGIEVGFLWDRARVELRESFLLSGPDVERAFGRSSPSPGREPLVGIFLIRGRQVTVVGNHFKSKGGDDPLFGVNDPPARKTEIQRKAQARVVRDFVSSVLKADPDALVVVAGDLNDFPFGEPGEGPDHPLAILEGRGEDASLTNLVLRVDEADAYTFIYQGNSQILDHILVSQALLRHVSAVDILHFNASFPAGLARDGRTWLRASDHDAVEARFQLR